MFKWIILTFLPSIFMSAANGQTVIPLVPAAGELPEGVAIDKPGNLWVTIQPLCQVRRYTPDYREVLRVDLVPRPSCLGANGLVVDANGTAFAAVFGADESTRGVYRIEPWGDLERLPGTGAIVYPNGLAFDRHNGNLYVTDFIRGAIWRIPHGEPAELWAEGGPLAGNLPLPPGFPPLNFPMGANGIAFDRGRVIVAVTYAPRLVSIPVNQDGSAGTPEILAGPPSFLSRQVYSLDGLALDVHGNFYVASPSSHAIIRVSPDGSDITTVAAAPEGITAAPWSLAFGTGQGNRQSLFVTINQSYGGSGSGVVRVPVETPGMPLP
jgi:sugar lactone lactonase YvrE